LLHIIWCIDVFIVEPYTWANGSRDSQSDISGQSSCTGPSAGCRGKANAAKISQPYHYWRLTEVQEWVLERFHWQVCSVAVPFLLTWAIVTGLCPSSINILLKHLLLWNPSLDFDQTSQKWCLSGPLPKLFKPLQ